MTPLVPQTLPIAEIDADALPRDRVTFDPQAIAQLSHSIALSGLRQPVEVWALQIPRPPFRYGLISGYRRLSALRALGTKDVQAFVRSPDSITTAMAEMVAENEIRTQISAWEKARLILTTVQEGHFDTPDAASAALFPSASRQTQYRLRSHTEVVRVLGDHLTTPEVHSSRRLDRLTAALRSGWENLLLTALIPLKSPTPSAETQWQAMLPILTESTTSDTTGDSPRPRRLLHLKKGLTIRRELTQHGYALRFSGPEARRGGMMDDVMDYVERWFQSE